MKKSQLIFATIALLLMSSCVNDGLNKSIMEPLTSSELEYNTTKDSLFVDFDEHVSQARRGIMKCENNIFQKFSEITYDQMYKYFKLKHDTIFINKCREDHQKKYNYKHQVDSILSYWKEYANRKNIDIANASSWYSAFFERDSRRDSIPSRVWDVLEFQSGLADHNSHAYEYWKPDERPGVQEFLTNKLILELIDENYEPFDVYLSNTIGDKMKDEDPDIYILYEYLISI